VESDDLPLDRFSQPHKASHVCFLVRNRALKDKMWI
jgi:hypothetical protein